MPPSRRALGPRDAFAIGKSLHLLATLPRYGRMMLRVALIVVVLGTAIGAIMPSGSPSPSNTDDNKVVEMAIESPSSGWPEPSASYGEIKLRRFEDGHFYADATVNGARIHFLIDTGASVIALTRADAMRASIALSPGQGEVIGQGAGGELHGEVVNLDRVELGHKQARGMTGVVVEGGEQSLLGQTFLSKFDSVEIHGDQMVLR